MLTRFISDSAWGSPEYHYPYDDTVNLNNKKLFVAGNMNVNMSPFLENLKDFSNNNFSTFYLTSKKGIGDVANVDIASKAAVSQNYPVAIGLNAENLLIREDTRFLECQSLYDLKSLFHIDFITTAEWGFRGLSGGSFVFSSANPPISAFEVGFSVSGQPPAYRTLYPNKYSSQAITNIRTSMANLTATIAGFGFLECLSGSSIETGNKQVYRYTLSAKNMQYDARKLYGYGFVLGNTKLGVKDKNDFIQGYGYSVRVRPGFTNYVVPPTFTTNNFYRIPRSIDPPIDQSTTMITVMNAVTAVFDENMNGISEPRPAAQYFRLLNVNYDQQGFSITFENKLPGSTSIMPYGLNLLFDDNFIQKMEVLSAGYYPGFSTAFRSKDNPQPRTLALPQTYYSTNTIGSVTGSSDIFLNLRDFRTERTFNPNIIKLVGVNNSIFFNFNRINDTQVIISHTLKDTEAFLMVDDIVKKVVLLDKSRVNDSNIELAKFNYIIDEETNRLLLFRQIDDDIYVLKRADETSLTVEIVESLNNLPKNSLFYIFTFIDQTINFDKNLWATYENGIYTNNLNIDSERSISIENNFLFHSEYSNSLSAIFVNFFPLKNQLNPVNNQNRLADSVTFRDYHTLYTGDNIENGADLISIGYNSDTKEYTFESGQVTWFHIPFGVNFKRIKLNDTSLIANGAIPGEAPLFSDKIWKKIGDYKYTSNLGNSNREQTGQWLCSWLSGANDGSNAVWMDRFYNPDIITKVEAVKFTNNIDYIPSYTSKNYTEGISDRISSLTFEPGVWYAYSHLGNADAQKIIKSLEKSLIQKDILNINKNLLGNYEFKNDRYGYLSINNLKTPANNFSLSFFGYSDNWSLPFGNQLIGNYLDSGFGIFNYKEVNPLNFYFNKNLIEIYNDDNQKILTITQPPSLSGNVVGVMRREYFENFHVVLDNLNILEYNLEGTLVDVVSGSSVFKNYREKTVNNVTNNLNTGVIYYTDSTYSQIDLKTNNVLYYNYDAVRYTNVNANAVSDKYNAYIDPFGNLYRVKGRSPLLREDKLYYVDNIDPNMLMVYNTITREINEYIDTKSLETSAIPQKVIVQYNNRDQVVREYPYSTFDLTGLSGAGLTLFTSTPQLDINDVYHVGFSIYKDPYIFYNSEFQTLSTDARNAVYVDLHGNYWYDHTVLKNPDVLNSDGFAKSTHISNANVYYFGDPFYQEQLGSTLATYGRVFSYTLKDNKIYYLDSFDIGPKPQIFNVKFDNDPIYNSNILDFANGTFLYLTNGTEIRSNPTFGGTPERIYALSSISIGFSYNGSTPSYFNPDQQPEPGTSVLLTLVDPVSTIYSLAKQLTGFFGRSVVPVPGQAFNYPLSSFFKIEVVSITDTSFETKITNKFPGATEFPLVFNSTRNYNGNLYIATESFRGVNGTGQDGENFGYDMDVISSLVNQTEEIVAISSPKWQNENGNSIGKVTIYQDVNHVFDSINLPEDDVQRITDFRIASSFEIRLPHFNRDGAMFGHSLALSGESSLEYKTVFVNGIFNEIDPQDGINKKLFIGAPISNSTNYPEGSAFFYNITYPDLIVTAVTALDVTGPADDGFGYKVDLHCNIRGVGSPYFSSNAGRVTLYQHRFNDITAVTGVDVDLPLYQNIGTPVHYTRPGRVYYGQSFKLNGHYMAIAGVTQTTPHVLIADIYRKNINFTTTPTYTYLTTLSTPWFDGLSYNITRLKDLKVSVDMNETNVVLGGWIGNEADIGEEYGKTTIWYRKHDEFYQMYSNSYVNDIPVVENDLPLTYFGNSVNLKKDKVLAGTTFIYNSGNSITWASSAICSAITNQTNKLSGYTGQVGAQDNNNFYFTVMSRLSAKAAKTALVHNVLTNNPVLCSNNTFYEAFNYDGSTLHYSGDIMSYSFDKNEETIILTDYHKLKIYDILGAPKTVIDLYQQGFQNTLSAFKFSIQNTVKNRDVKEDLSMFAVNREKEIYKVNYNIPTSNLVVTKIDSQINKFFTSTEFAEQILTFDGLINRDYDINNNYLMLSDLRIKYPEPSLSFKLRLNNRLDYEESDIFSPILFISQLSRGWHHFAITFDSNNGRYKGYVDLKKVFDITLLPNKYSFTNILRNNLIVGSSPYYNNIVFDDFYKSSNSSYFVDGLQLSNVYFYNKALSETEIRFLSYERFEPEPLKVEIQYGERNYVDTISRVFRQKSPGIKSSLIDIVINDSLITDLELQKFVEQKIIMELKDYLPSYVRVNSIKWVSNKPAREKIVEGDINIGNTLTNTGGVE